MFNFLKVGLIFKEAKFFSKSSICSIMNLSAYDFELLKILLTCKLSNSYFKA